MRKYRRQPWNDEQRRRLIGLVKQFDELWKPMPNDLHYFKVRRQALNQVQKHFVADGFSVDDVKEQWRNLKDIFYKRYELMIRRAQSGEKPGKVKPCWVHFEELRFLASPEAIGNGRSRRGLAYGSIEEVERQIGMSQQAQDYEDIEFEGEEEEGEGDWPEGEQEPEMEEEERQAIVRMAVKLEQGEDHGHGQQLGHAHQQQEGLILALAAPELGQHPPVESSMCRLSRTIDRTIQKRQRKEQGTGPFPPHQPALNGQQQQNKRGEEGGWSMSAPGPSTSHAQSPSIEGNVPMPATRKRKQPAAQEGGQHPDRFKCFGVFVESAVRDLHQQSPELARRLLQNIYSTISAHQMEAAAGEFDWANGKFD